MPIVALCCSKRFKKEEREFAKGLRKLGVTVYEPPLDGTDWGNLKEKDKMAMAAGYTLRHFHKIRKSEAIFVLNIGGYVGNSVNLEIGYAAALDKKIFFLEEETVEYARIVLSDGFAKTPKELVATINNVKTPDVLD